MTHHSSTAGHRRRSTPDPAALDRQADLLLAAGQHRQAEQLAHAAAAFRSASVLAPRRALAALVAGLDE